MDLETIIATFQDMTLSQDQLEETFHQFSKESEATDLKDFAVYLHRNKLIDTKSLSNVLTQSHIEITDFEYLKKTASQSRETEESPNYDILGEVGQGGMGEILLAKDQHLLRTVAYKKLHPQFSQRKEVLEQFLNEVQITSQLEHPNVVPIYNMEVSADGNIAYAMKLVQGKTFKEYIQEAKGYHDAGEPLPRSHSLSAFLEHFLKVCDALEFAHSKGVLHRDLKPANIMVGAYNEVCVMDWGIACLIGQVPESANQAVGTPRFMSPEQAGGLNHALDARSDLFSLGLILFELVTLKQATPRAKTLLDTLRNTIKGLRNPVEHYVPGTKIPPELEAIIDKATQRKRKDRYQSVKEMAADIRRYLKGEAVEAKPDTPLQAIARWISLNRDKTLLAIFVILLLSASLLILSMYYRHVSLIAAQKHEDQIHHATNLVAVRGNQIDQHFFYLEGLLRSYGTAIQQRLKYGQPFKGAYFTLQDYQNPQTRPANTRFVDKYRTDVNIDYGMILHAPGSDPVLMQSLSSIMHPLQHVMKDIVIQSYDESGQNTLDAARADQLILDRKMPILWIFMALENGYYMIYPSTYNYKDGYDPRQRPWYKMAKNTGKFAWQEPYRTTGGEVDLPCLMPLYNDKKEYMGVAVIEMTFDFVQSHYLDFKLPGVQESALVNQKGEIIVSTVDHYSAGRDQKKKAAKTQLVSVDNETVKKALKNKRSGHHIESTPEGNTLYIYHYISSLEWFYVIKAQETAFLNTVDQY